MKPILIICFLCGTGYIALAQQKSSDAEMKELQEQHQQLTHYIELVKDTAVALSKYIDNATNDIFHAKKELRKAQKSSSAGKDKVDSLQQKLTSIEGKKIWSEKQFDALLFRLDSCVGVLNGLKAKINAVQKQ